MDWSCFKTILAGIIITLGEGASAITSCLLITAAYSYWAVDNHLTAISDGASSQTVTFVKGVVAGSVSLFIGCLFVDQAMVLGDVVPAIIVGIFACGFSIVICIISVQNKGTTRSHILFSTAPIWGVILSYLFVH